MGETGGGNRWRALGGRPTAEEYAERFERLARSGSDVHGEADCCSRLATPPADVLDAGCGTGRVAIELARRGFRCVGVDVDEQMLDLARRAGPGLRWEHADLVDLAVLDASGEPQRFELVVAAGNVIPLLAPGTEGIAVQRLADHVRSGGLLVAGFGLDTAHLPLDEAPFSIEQYDRWCEAAELVLVERWATWDGDAWSPEAGYAVSVHRRSGTMA